MNLWGDETYSLNVAAKSIDEILVADLFHLPTNYLLLYPIVGFLAHWQVLAGPWPGAVGVMFLTILLSNYIFYATNIRMFALLSAASLALLWTAFRLLTPGARRPQAAARLRLVTMPALAGAPGL